MATLTELSAIHGFAAGDINTDGYVGMVNAYQKKYYCDGRDYNNKGYHKLDFVNDKITATSVTAKFTRGEPVTQDQGAGVVVNGIYDECTDVILAGTQTGTFVLGEKVVQAVTLAIGYVVNVAAGVLTVCPVSRSNLTGEPIDFTASANTVTGITSSATIGTVTGVSAIGEGLYHFIYRTETTPFEITTAIVGGISGASLVPAAITAPPHWLTWKPVASWVDPDDDSILVTNPGLMPDGGSNIMTLCFGRVFLNSMTNPHQWFCTRNGDPLDFDSSQTDVGASTSSQNTLKAGLIGSPIIAMVGYKDRYLVMGCVDQVYIMRGDPLMGGVNDPVSKETGFFSPTSWCWDDENSLWFMGIDGIYKLTSAALTNAQPPENMTKERIPRLISAMGLNRRTDRVTMKYDKTRYGILISASQKDGSWDTTFWFDLRTGGVFPDAYPSGQNPASLHFFDSYKKSERALLMGGYDGYIRKLDDDQKSDDGSNAIDSFFCVGPFVDDKNPRNKLTTGETALTLGEDTDGATVDIFRAESADELVTNVKAGNAPAATKTLTGDGLKSSMRDRISGRAIGIRIGNSTVDESFSLESQNTKIKKSGKQN